MHREPAPPRAMFAGGGTAEAGLGPLRTAPRAGSGGSRGEEPPDWVRELQCVTLPPGEEQAPGELACNLPDAEVRPAWVRMAVPRAGAAGSSCSKRQRVAEESGGGRISAQEGCGSGGATAAADDVSSGGGAFFPLSPAPNLRFFLRSASSLEELYLGHDAAASAPLLLLESKPQQPQQQQKQRTQVDRRPAFFFSTFY